MWKKIRKKPVEVKGIQFKEGFFGDRSISQEIKDIVCRNDCEFTKPRPHIHTLEGNHYIIVGDWIIEGINGEHYPIKPDIFEKTYEIVDK